MLILSDIIGSEELFRTKIQKMMYFAAQKNVIKDSFKNKYYGPFSSKVAQSIESMVEGRYLNEKIHYFSNGYVGHSYYSSDDVKDIMPIIREKNKDVIVNIEQIVAACKGKTSNEISKAAKIHYILKNKGKEMTDSQIISSAKEFDWNITQEEIEASTELLLSLKLIKLSK